MSIKTKMIWRAILKVGIFIALGIQPSLSQCPVDQLTSSIVYHEDFNESSSPSSAILQAPSTSKERDIDQRQNGYSEGNLVWNAISPQVPLISSEDSAGILALKAVAPQGMQILRVKREATLTTMKRRSNPFGLQQKDEVLSKDQSLEALLEKIVTTYMRGCDLIIIYDKIYQGSNTLETLVNFPVIKQVLQLVSQEDLSDKIEWLSKNCQGTILLLSEPELLLQFGNINRFDWAYRANVVIVGLSLESLETFLNTTKGKKTENIIGVVEDPINHHFKLYMNLLFWGEGLQPVTDWWGTRFTRRTNLFPDKVTNLHLGQVRVFVFEWRPIMFYERDEKGNVIGKYGRDLTIVRTLAKLFNFTLVFVDIEQDWGLPLPNGSFTGLVGYLGRDEGQMGLAYLYSSGLDGRHRVQDYSRPIEDDKGCFLTRVEAPMPPWQNPSLPFQTETWLAFFIGLVLSGPIFYLIVTASRGDGEEYSQYKSLLSTILLTTGIHFSHPVVVLPKHRSSQIFIIFLLIYILVLSAGYRSNLTSFLTIAIPPKRLETFKDMYESGLQVKSISWFYNALNHSGNPYLQKLLDRYEVRLTFEELIEEFMAGKTATINSKAYLEVLSTLMRTKKGKPLVRFLSECLSTYSVGIGLQWHTPLKPKFNKAIARLVESGIVRRWFLQANEQYRMLVEKEGGISYYPDSWYDRKDGAIPLGLSHMQGIFAVFALGYIFATISFAVEVLSCCR